MVSIIQLMIWVLVLFPELYVLENLDCFCAGEKRGVAGLLLGRTERAARAAELQLCAQAR